MRASPAFSMPEAISGVIDEEKPVMRDRILRMGIPVARWSPSSGSISRLPAWAPPRQRLSDTPHSLKPEQKFSVPSMGSSTAIHPSRAWGRVLAEKLSSPIRTRPGNRSASHAVRRRSRKMSAAVTGLSSSFQWTSVRRASISGRLSVISARTSSSRDAIMLRPRSFVRPRQSASRNRPVPDRLLHKWHEARRPCGNRSDGRYRCRRASTAFPERDVLR